MDNVLLSKIFSWLKNSLLIPCSLLDFDDVIAHLLFVTLFIFQLARPHNDPERVLHRKIVELSSLIRKLDEKNQQLAIRNEEMVRMNFN